MEINNGTEHKKFGWRINEFASAVGLSRARIYELLEEKQIAAVKCGGARIITTHPKDFLASLAGKAS
jgi:hypothetical protein